MTVKVHVPCAACAFVSHKARCNFVHKCLERGTDAACFSRDEYHLNRSSSLLQNRFKFFLHIVSNNAGALDVGLNGAETSWKKERKHDCPGTTKGGWRVGGEIMSSKVNAPLPLPR